MKLGKVKLVEWLINLSCIFRTLGRHTKRNSKEFYGTYF